MIKKIFPAFGTVNTITVYDRCDPSLLEEIKQKLLEMHCRFSFFRPDSEIGQINANAGIRPVVISEDTASLLSLAVRYARDTWGAFDVTAGASSQLWKDAIRSAAMPSQAQIVQRNALCGMKDLVLDPHNHTAFLRRKGMKIDLGGIVKGYAADTVRFLLQGQGIENACINLGGTVSVMGKEQKIGIQHPFQKTGIPMARILLKNKSIVTSGAYEQCFFHQGNRFHHIIDPRTGKPADSGLLSVSLIGEKAAALDALATGICCLGQERGMQLIRTYGLSAILVSNDGCVEITPELQGHISFEEQHISLSRRSIS